jgi:hypothetical protein
VVVVSTETVRVEVTAPSGGGVTCSGLKVAVTPEGAPEAVSWTGWLKPAIDFILIVDASESPRGIVSEAGEVVIKKSGVISPSIVSTQTS